MAVSEKDKTGSSAPSHKEPTSGKGNHSPPVSDKALLLFFLALAAALVFGYLFLNKLVDISQQEDCMLGNRRNCRAAVESPNNR